MRGDLPPPPNGNQLEAPTVRIDPVLRKALLKALNNLEKESTEASDGDITTENFFTTTESEELLEESTSADRLNKPAQNIQFTAFTFDRNSSDTDHEDNTIYRTVVVPRTTLSPPRETPKVVFSAPDPVKEGDIHIETIQVARSVQTKVKANDVLGDKISDKVLALSKQALTSTTSTTTPAAAPVTTTTTTTTSKPTTTTTTTEAPVTNADGENIEKVNDVQIHQAPLVAAFTVQQDAQGLPKSVQPIFKQLIEPQQQNNNAQQQNFQQKQNQLQQNQQPLRPSQPLPNNNNNFPGNLNPYHQFALEAKQRELEQRIQYLQAQQRQQEQYYRQQQFLFDQRQRFEQEQRFRQQQQQQGSFPPFSPLIRNGGVQILPSISLSNNQINPAINNNNFNDQNQLPVKDAGTFRITNEQRLPFLPAVNFNKENVQKSLPGPLQLQPQLQLPQRSFIPFNSAQVSIVPSVSAQLKNNNIDQGAFLHPLNAFNPLTRVFRQEQSSPAFEQQQSQQLYVPPQASAQNLQQLLFQSGVAGRGNEDFNIISRVLALNHGIQAPLNGNFINQQ